MGENEFDLDYDVDIPIPDYDIELPEDLTFNSSLSINGGITAIPEGTRFEGDFMAFGSEYCGSLQDIPEETIFNGAVRLEALDELVELPENLLIQKDLVIINGGLKNLPEELQVNGYLDISETDITHIPDTANIKDGILVNPRRFIPNNPSLEDTKKICGLLNAAFMMPQKIECMKTYLEYMELMEAHSFDKEAAILWVGKAERNEIEGEVLSFSIAEVKSEILKSNHSQTNNQRPITKLPNDSNHLLTYQI